MKILYDENIPCAEAFLGELGQLRPFAGRTLTRDLLADADVLLVRSVTRVDEALVADTPVRFVGSCTIGTDHLDTAALDRLDIRWCNAPGCNADAVADYVMAALLELAEGEVKAVLGRRVLIVGAGNVGGRLASRLRALDMEVLLCDPPRAEREGAAGFVSLDEGLAEAEIVCCHTPLTRVGPHPTFHLLDQRRLEALRPGCWLINAGRGPVIDNQALKGVVDARDDLRVVLDVWEPEPAVDPELVAKVQIATPHIAGYSLEGRVRGTAMVAAELWRFLGRELPVTLADVLPAGPVVGPATGTPAAEAELTRALYDIRADDGRFRTMVGRGELPAGFDRLRRDYPLRRDMGFCRLLGESVPAWLEVQGMQPVQEDGHDAAPA